MRIAIVGYGVEGKSSYVYFKLKYPDATFSIYDDVKQAKSLYPNDAELFVGDPIINQSIDADIVVRSPSIAPNHITTDGRITSVTKEFFNECPAPIIGVTGTKGKGTTASLIHSILTAAGKKSWLVGNIGTPALSELSQIKSDEIVVYELSSFQLWDLDSSPHVAVVLMVEPDHLDIHDGFTDYLEAKGNIRRYQTSEDICYFDPENEYSTYIAEQTVQDGSVADARGFGVIGKSDVFVKGNTFFVHSDPICSIDKLQLIGQHNVRNACAAISAVLSYVDDFSAIEQGLTSFAGLPHRLKFVRELRGIKYIDDSIATTPGSAIAAIRSFDSPKILILGGSNKGADFRELYDTILSNDVRHVITIGAMGEKIANDLQEAGYQSIKRLGIVPMQEIVATASDIAQEGDVVIMSPACASFDMFKSYVDRGEQFVAAVDALK